MPTKCGFSTSPPVIGPPRDDAPHGFARACCVCALRAQERAKITENWIFSKFSKFDREINLTILVNFPSDYSCVCTSVLGIYRPKGGDLANPIITLFLRDFWPIQIFLQSASPSDCQTFYTGSWGGRPVGNHIYTGRGPNSVFSQVDYCTQQGGILESRNFLEQVSSWAREGLLVHSLYVYTPHFK